MKVSRQGDYSALGSWEEGRGRREEGGGSPMTLKDQQYPGKALGPPGSNTEPTH